MAFGKKRATSKKIQDFRTKVIKVSNYDANSTVINLSAGKSTIELTMELTRLGNDIMLSFTGDGVATDGTALAKIVQALWNEKIPEFPLSDDLRDQLGIAVVPVETGRMYPENDELGAPLGTSRPVNVDREPIYFKNVAHYIAGLGNEIYTTVRQCHSLD